MKSNLYVFDAYGTLLDVNSAVGQHAAAVGADAARLSELWRAKQLEYSWVYSLIGRYEPFWLLTERALDHALARLPSVDVALKPRLLDAYRNLAAYPEVAEVLAALRARSAGAAMGAAADAGSAQANSDVRTAVLSNGNASMLDAAFSSAGLLPLLDRVISVDAAGVFKTSPKTYELVTEAFNVSPGEVTFVSSNRWDVAGASAFGFRAIWVNRAGLPDEYLDFPPMKTVRDLREI
ncbi:MAG: HAD family hydrolase [Burkholderiales bacterium]|nr:MAG: HAD family hydrolase [Betaproteobacteria bacterium]TAG83166.1 MAG: HAD family hydrolase [Burkholderiales bacterium]